MIIKIIIGIIIYIVGVIISTIIDAKLKQRDRGQYDQYFSMLSWMSAFILCITHFIDYIYNKVKK